MAFIIIDLFNNYIKPLLINEYEKKEHIYIIENDIEHNINENNKQSQSEISNASSELSTSQLYMHL